MMSLKSNNHRALLLTAAAHTVSKYGVDVSVSRIAKAAGVDETTLFKHFVSKEALLNTLYVDIHCDLCSKLRECVVLGEPLLERARAIWNSYIDWGLANPERRGARHRLMVSDILTDHTRKTEALLFPDVGLAEAGSESDVFGDHPPEFGETIFIALADATIDFAGRDPQRADLYKQSGFDAHWRVFFA
ncbi:TetR/AcrR family transcriptional regulator [Massilia niabensis]|uniref:TetR/AcrR family transcriptional regulator n=1 Tax=Massilia niabensis TaxID=544910 RepID=A0ABW0L209_9BURK